MFRWPIANLFTFFNFKGCRISSRLSCKFWFLDCSLTVNFEKHVHLLTFTKYRNIILVCFYYFYVYLFHYDISYLVIGSSYKQEHAKKKSCNFATRSHRTSGCYCYQISNRRSKRDIYPLQNFKRCVWVKKINNHQPGNIFKGS